MESGTSGALPSACAFVDVSVVPVDGAPPLEHQTVVTRDGRIAALAPAAETAVPEDAAVIPGEGRYLMPALADMHIHMQAGSPYWANDLFLYVANGVTTVREMWGNAAFLRYRELSRAGLITAPRMILASPGMDGPPGRFGALTPYVTTPSEAGRLVAQYRRDGYHYIKVYSDLAADVCRHGPASTRCWRLRSIPSSTRWGWPKRPCPGAMFSPEPWTNRSWTRSPGGCAPAAPGTCPPSP